MVKFLLASLLFCSSVFGVELEKIELTVKNIAYISETIDKTTALSDIKSIAGSRLMLPMDKTLYIIIASYGGDIDAAYAIERSISVLPNVKVICTYCASAAGHIFLASDVPRLVVKNSKMMMHEVKQTMTAAECTKDRIEAFKKDSDDFNKIFEQKLGLTSKEYCLKIKDTNWTVDSAEMLKLGLADKLVSVKCDDFVKQIAPNTCQE